MRRTNLLLITILVLIGALACHAATGRYSVRLTAHPQAITADAHSATTISAEVRDPNGMVVPDGTIIEFTTSIGIIERSARTVAGVARVRLLSGSTTGTAAISAVAADGAGLAELTVDFLEPGTEMFDESFISITSKNHLGFDADRQIIDSAGGVEIASRGVLIQADQAQIDVRGNVLRAKGKPGDGDIIIKRGKKQLTASAMVYNLSTMKGVLIGPVDEGAKRMLFRGRDLFVEPDTDPDPKIKFDFEPITDSKIFVRARSIIVRPGEEIKFKHANYYLEGQKVLSVPLQVVPLRGRGSTGLDRTLTYGTQGIRLDLPVYYSLTPNATGALRIKHGDSTGWGSYSQQPGWQLDLDHDYNFGGTTQGTFTVNRITSSDWGLRWNQRLQMDDDSQVYTYFDFPSHRDVYGTMDYSKPFKDFTWSMNLRGSRLRSGLGGYYAGTYLQTNAKPLIGGAVSYAFTSRMSFDNQASAINKLGTGLGLQLYGKPVQFGSSASLSTSLMATRDWGGSVPGLNVFGSAGIYKTLGAVGQVGFNYAYAWGDSTVGGSDHRLSFNVSLRPAGKWSTNLYAVYGMSDRSLSAFGDLSYNFMPTWRVGVQATQQRFQYSKYTDAEYLLSKVIGRQEVMLTYSQSQKRFRIEFAPLAF